MKELIFPAADDLKKDERAEPSARFVCFVLAGQNYGVNVSGVREVLRMPEIASVPGAPPACRGVINLRGHIVSVLDLRRMLSLPEQPDSAHTRVLVCDHPGGLVALQVDQVMDLLTVPLSKIERTPAVNSQPVPVSGIVTRASGPLFLLDPEQLLHKMTGRVAA